MRANELDYILGTMLDSNKDVSDLNITVDKQTKLVVTGVDRQLVGQVAANIRSIRKPEPYKGKGVRYAGERILRKAGKTGKK